jgi:DHA1 family tetracycline resistance protein-like MFS transporter
MEAKDTRMVIALISAIVFMDMAGVGIIVPVLPGLIGELSGSDLQNSALIGGGLMLVYSVMLFFCAPIIGGLSDRFGRRPVLLATLTAMGIDYLLMAWAPTLAWLFLGRAISGITGATWAASNSVIADLFPPEERGARFGMLGGAGAAGFILGPVLGGLLGEIDLRLPFMAAGVVALCGALLGWFFFRETLPPEKRRAFTLRRANPLGTLIQMAKLPVVIGLIGCIFLMTLSSQATNTIWAFYLIEKFDWSTLQIGLSAAVYGFLLAAVQGVLTGKLTARYGAIRTATIGLIACIPPFFLIGLAPSGLVLYLGIIIGALGGLAFPSMQGLMSERIDPDAQGELQGAVASTISISAMMGPLIMPPLFAAFSDDKGLYLPGMPFILSAILAIIAGLLFWHIVRRYLSPSNMEESK